MEQRDRVWIIGNGPSLKDTNLDLLVDEVTFGCNRILPLYKQTKMRLSHYVRAEGLELVSSPSPSLWMDDALYHLEKDDCHTWMNPYFRIKLGQSGHSDVWSERKPGMVTWIGACSHYQAHYSDIACPTQWHLPNFCSFGGSVVVAIQIAVHLGFQKIYLVGCDLGYKDGEPNHYFDGYENGYEAMLNPARYANMDTLMGHIIAKRSSPVPIFNATVGGALEAYERVNYEEVLCATGL